MRFSKIVNGLTSYYYRFRLKMKGCIIGRGAHFCGHISFSLATPKNFYIGNGFVLTGGRFINPMGCLRGSAIRIDGGG